MISQTLSSAILLLRCIVLYKSSIQQVHQIQARKAAENNKNVIVAKADWRSFESSLLVLFSCSICAIPLSMTIAKNCRKLHKMFLFRGISHIFCEVNQRIITEVAWISFVVVKLHEQWIFSGLEKWEANCLQHSWSWVSCSPQNWSFENVLVRLFNWKKSVEKK